MTKPEQTVATPDRVLDALVHAWSGAGLPKTGPVSGEKLPDYTAIRLYQHECGAVEEWRADQLPGGCDACESSPLDNVTGGWYPLYRLASDYGNH
jgi:hypothetical protein